MTKTLEKSEDKIQAICDVLRKETLEPAEAKAENLVAAAQEEAEKIIHRAHQRADEIVQEGRRKIDQERSVFRSAMDQGVKQALEVLRQSIESSLFNLAFAETVEKKSQDPEVISRFIQAMVAAIEREGVEADLQAAISEKVSPEEVNALLGKEILKRLKEHSVVLTGIAGGAEVKVVGKELTLVLSDAVLKHLLGAFLRKEFRKILFV